MFAWLIIFIARWLWLVGLAAIALWWWQALPRRRTAARFVALVLPLTYLLGKLVGHFYYDPRPFVTGHFSPLIAHAPDNGFPSDHTLLLATLAVTAMRYDRRWAVVLWVITFLVGWARVAAGLHHWVDIISAVAVALLANWLAGRIIKT